MEFSTCVKQYAMELIVIVINCVLALGGAIVLYMAIHIRHAGWENVIHGYWATIDIAVTALIVIGSVIIGLAVVGSIAAFCRWKFVIYTYGIVMVLLLLFFVVVAIVVFILLGKADDWSDKTYPAESMEETVKSDFDNVYCYAQGEFVCNEASVTETLAMFAPEINTTVMSLLQNITGGVTTLCDDYLDDYRQLESLCTACNTMSKFKNYSTVLDWADDKCPRTNETMTYCGQLIAGISTNITVGTAPYSQCRAKFLDLIEDYSLYLGIASVLVCLGALLLIIFVCCLSRRQQIGYNHAESDEYPLTPLADHTSSEQYSKA
ncbi:hypothetical protein KXD40_001630 [Peronospora effusa]|uniref:Tetraspanin n=1 Tax=Peronospora effusa TaxID=542832 RepID=A0A3M6VRQ5_9STRA|nr:hypothetical protein DD238_001104 [Peronospora effusa]UIZ27006.1 hypothetical protein KXD40_001630 [Peronospora effusa]CAI5712690.1 unnamed protein product [Peronospora effusa]